MQADAVGKQGDGPLVGLQCSHVLALLGRATASILSPDLPLPSYAAAG
jgi:hypothetical protein